MAKLNIISKAEYTKNSIILVDSIKKISEKEVSKEDLKFIKKTFKKDDKSIDLSTYNNLKYIVIVNKETISANLLEQVRIAGSKIASKANTLKIKEININSVICKKEVVLALAEGIALSNYQFIKYFSDKKKKENTLSTINIFSKDVKKKDIEKLSIIIDSVFFTRNLVNEPVSYLTAEKLSSEIKAVSKKAGFTIEVFNKNKIEALKMGGLLAVNKGSIDPPTFSILTWKPKNAKNKKPIVLVGKGVVFDTGGLSLKPTAGSMDEMKSDMAGAAAVAGTLKAISEARLPVYVIGLIPATDNRPGQNAYAPQDVITMLDGTTVEVLNTDAEGRMILADALAYAKKYKPELVVDLATLTGAAWAAIGQYAIVGMGNANEKKFSKLKKSGENVHERIVEFPFWEEYGELIKSDVADIKNIGGKVAGAITAGKFLEHFTDYPYIHLDIAGPAYISSNDAYRPKNGTAVGVRLLFDYFDKF